MKMVSKIVMTLKYVASSLYDNWQGIAIFFMEIAIIHITCVIIKRLGELKETSLTRKSFETRFETLKINLKCKNDLKYINFLKEEKFK